MKSVFTLVLLLKAFMILISFGTASENITLTIILVPWLLLIKFEKAPSLLRICLKPTTPTVPSTPTIPEQPNVTEDSEIVETQKEEFNNEKIKKKNKKKTKKVDNSKKVRIDKKWYAPKTGDNSIILIYIAIVLAVLCTIFAILSYLKKKK